MMNTYFFLLRFQGDLVFLDETIFFVYSLILLVISTYKNMKVDKKIKRLKY